MTVSRKLTPALILMTLAALPGCMTSPSGTAINRMKPQAVNCAEALADGPIEAARTECLAHLAQVEAALDW